MMRRFRRPFINAVPMTAAQIEVMSKANALAASQQFGQAAPLFAELAREMEASQHPRRAANLHARAAHAYADAGNATEALAQARVALNLFVQYQMVQRTPEFYANITRKLTQHGMVEATNALKAEFGGKVGAYLLRKRLRDPINCSPPIAQSAVHLWAARSLGQTPTQRSVVTAAH